MIARRETPSLERDERHQATTDALERADAPMLGRLFRSLFTLEGVNRGGAEDAAEDREWPQKAQNAQK